jgi:hypothetical protein
MKTEDAGAGLTESFNGSKLLSDTKQSVSQFSAFFAFPNMSEAKFMSFKYMLNEQRQCGKCFSNARARARRGDENILRCHIFVIRDDSD